MMSSRKIGAAVFANRAFTLVELLLAMAILTVILITLATVMSQTTGAWRQARSQLEQFREAETAFDSMNRRITDAVLNTYTDYEFPNGNRQLTPTRYIRQSDLHFVCGPARTGGATAPALLGAAAAPGHAVFFQGPFGEHESNGLTGLNTLLNAWGYFIEFGDDRGERPAFLADPAGTQTRYRFRLKEFQQKTEQLTVFGAKLSSVTQPTTLYSWFAPPALSGQGVHTLAENVVALVIRPLSPDSSLAGSNQIASHYYYDSRAFQRGAGTPFEQARSRHQLPPMLEITVVVLDETSGAWLQDLHGSAMPDLGLGSLFQDAMAYEDDLATLESTLVSQKLHYRTLKKTVRLRNARWSTVD